MFLLILPKASYLMPKGLKEEDKSGPMEARREMDTVLGNTVCPNKA